MSDTFGASYEVTRWLECMPLTPQTLTNELAALITDGQIIARIDNEKKVIVLGVSLFNPPDLDLVPGRRASTSLPQDSRGTRDLFIACTGLPLIAPFFETL